MRSELDDRRAARRKRVAASEAGDEKSDGAIVRKLPPGRHGLTREQVAESQRQRLFDAIAHLSSEHGYNGFSIADVVRRAGVSRATFYELFRNKEECFVGAIELQLRRLMNAVAPAFREADEWPDRVENAIAALLDFIVEEPEYARMSMLEAYAAGPAAYDRYSTGWRLFIAMMDEGRNYARFALPPNTGRAALGAAEQLIVDEMLAGRTHRVRTLLPTILFVILLPYLGMEEALLRSRAAAERRQSAVA
ncbi:MAG TPA: helix-turn-helix domain-containing protein [Solirubrobacterales bacterium]|jgi:AcrR family transcriptional regulator